ncbi:MAG: hypothetical protein K5765_06130 [Clostridia bacterium]|nr:hypothetical protein [Clostridia bacterium]
MSKYKKRIVPEYENIYSDTVPEYYGVFIEKYNGKIVSVKVDPKRLRKTRLIDNELYNEIQSINRNTPYFHPAKKIGTMYCFEVFRKQINGLRKLWDKEIKPAVEKLETPDQAGDRVYVNNVASGIMDVEESEISRTMTKIVRTPVYQYAIQMFYAQFILLMGAEVEAVMVKVITAKGYTGEKFNREYLKGYVSGHVEGLDYTKFDNHCYYDKIYKIWNFLKHNNIDVFEKVRESYPEVLINPEAPYINGDIAIRYLKLTEELIMELLEGVAKFFDEFCKKVFGEVTDYPEWNTEVFYVRLVKDEIRDITNPLGLPWYV